MYVLAHANQQISLLGREAQSRRFWLQLDDSKNKYCISFPLGILSAFIHLTTKKKHESSWNHRKSEIKLEFDAEKVMQQEKKKLIYRAYMLLHNKKCDLCYSRAIYTL